MLIKIKLNAFKFDEIFNGKWTVKAFVFQHMFPNSLALGLEVMCKCVLSNIPMIISMSCFLQQQTILFLIPCKIISCISAHK